MSLLPDTRLYHLRRAREAILAKKLVFPAVPAVAVDTPEEKERDWATCPTDGLVLFVRSTGQFWCWVGEHGWLSPFNIEDWPKLPEPEVPYLGGRS